MNEEEARLRKIRRDRIARTKRILRWLPRRTNLHRYPGLKRYATRARRTHELWSFRTRPVVVALYAGSILSFLPLYGVQLVLSVLAATLLRANLPILVGLQFITNPLTILPIYFAAYQIGRVTLGLLGVSVPLLNRAQLEVLLQNIFAMTAWGENFAYFAKVFGVTSLGGIILGIFVATIASWIYRLGAYEVTKTYTRLRELQEQREANANDPAPGPPAADGSEATESEPPENLNPKEE